MDESKEYSLHENEKRERCEVIHALCVLILYQNEGKDIKFTCERDKYYGWQGTMKPSF